MEREHLIIIALILVALYMMNKDTKDTVQGMGPAGRIRYNDPQLLPPPGVDPMGHEPFAMPERIRLGDRDYGKGHFIRNHIRHDNRNNVFSGMMGTGCGEENEKFRFTDDCCATDSCGAPC